MTQESVLKMVAENIAKEQNYEKYIVDIKHVTSGGANFTSYLYQIKISGDHRDDLHLFGKVAAFGEEMRKDSMMAYLYNLELYFYQVISPIFRVLEEKYKILDENRLLMSKMYAYSSERLEEVIVLDDLTKKGFKCFDRLKPLGWKEMSRLVEELAKFHSLSFAYGHNFPEEFAETLIRLKIASTSPESTKFFTVWSSMIKATSEVLRGRNRQLYDKFFEEHMDDTLHKFVKEGRQSVFIHGDFKPGNLLQRVNKDGGLDVVILDLQTIRCSSVVVDLMYLIFNSTDQEFRRQHYDQLIEHYYTQLREALQRLEVDPDLVYSREDYQQELKENQILGLAISAFCLQLVTIEESDAPKVDGNMSMENFMMKPSSTFKKRFTEIVEDFVNWGLLK